MSRYQSAKPATARLILLFLIVAVVAGAFFGRQPHVIGIVSEGEFSDVDMHGNVVSRVHAGESYYRALGDELRTNGYATKPFFHWRMPTLLWGLAKLPHHRIGHALLIALAVIMAAIWLIPLKSQLGFPATCVAALIVAAPMLALTFMRNWYLQHELWAGVLIAVSLGIYRKSVAAAVVLGLLALAIRELTLLYVLIMLGFAIRQKRIRESIAWATGILAFAALLTLHAAIVSKHSGPSELSDPSWLRLAGWPHAVACANWMFLAATSHWLAGAALVLAIFGATASADKRLAAIVILYTLTFTVVGKPYNHYWGVIYVPLLAIGLSFSIRAITDLTIAARNTRRQTAC